jgi:hypothetical protein
MGALFGVLCRLLWYSSLAYDCKSNVTLELSTPRSTAPDAVLFCSRDSSAIQSSAQVALQSLQQAGDLWQQAGGRELIVHAADSTEAPASGAFSIAMFDPARELATDPFYASGYALDWCACFAALTATQQHACHNLSTIASIMYWLTKFLYCMWLQAYTHDRAGGSGDGTTTTGLCSFGQQQQQQWCWWQLCNNC